MPAPYWLLSPAIPFDSRHYKIWSYLLATQKVILDGRPSISTFYAAGKIGTFGSEDVPGAWGRQFAVARAVDCMRARLPIQDEKGKEGLYRPTNASAAAREEN
jgi:hypothetical protein